MINRNDSLNLRLNSAKSARYTKYLEKDLFNSLLYSKQLINLLKGNNQAYLLSKQNLTERNMFNKFFKSPLVKYQKFTKEYKLPYKSDKINKPALLKVRSIDTIKKLIKKTNPFLPEISNTFLNECNNNIEKKLLNSSNIMIQSMEKNITYRSICHTYGNQEDKYNYNELIKLFPKMEPIKINVNIPIKKKKINIEEMIEKADKVDIDYYEDRELQKRIAETLHKDFNTMDKNFEVYFKQFYKSIPNYINYIYDINILPHIQNKFLFVKPIEDKNILSEKITCRNLLQKEVAISMNRNTIKSILMKKKEEEEKLDKLNKTEDKKDSILQKEVDSKEKEVFDNEIKDYFMKIRNYKELDIADPKYKSIVYNKFKK